jgi:hypothetical protein
MSSHIPPPPLEGEGAGSWTFRYLQSLLRPGEEAQNKLIGSLSLKFPQILGGGEQTVMSLWSLGGAGQCPLISLSLKSPQTPAGDGTMLLDFFTSRASLDAGKRQDNTHGFLYL